MTRSYKQKRIQTAKQFLLILASYSEPGDENENENEENKEIITFLIHSTTEYLIHYDCWSCWKTWRMKMAKILEKVLKLEEIIDIF